VAPMVRHLTPIVPQPLQIPATQPLVGFHLIYGETPWLHFALQQRGEA